MAEIVYRDLSTFKPHPDNPRKSTAEGIELLAKSIQEKPNYFEVRPILLSNRTGELVIIGGERRWESARYLGLKEAPSILMEGLTLQEELDIIFLDNVHSGVWDEQKLAKWDKTKLQDWGVELPDWNSQTNGGGGKESHEENNYTKKITIPVYEPSDVIPTFEEMYDKHKYEELLAEINNTEMDEDVRAFLKASASRHIVYNYEKIADFYASAHPKIQDLMERSALVIIDFDKAIKYGFVRLTKDLANQYIKENNIDAQHLTETDLLEDYDAE